MNLLEVAFLLPDMEGRDHGGAGRPKCGVNRLPAVAVVTTSSSVHRIADPRSSLHLTLTKIKEFSQCARRACACKCCVEYFATRFVSLDQGPCYGCHWPPRAGPWGEVAPLWFGFLVVIKSQEVNKTYSASAVNSRPSPTARGPMQSLSHFAPRGRPCGPCPDRPHSTSVGIYWGSR